MLKIAGYLSILLLSLCWKPYKSIFKLKVLSFCVTKIQCLKPALKMLIAMKAYWRNKVLALNGRSLTNAVRLVCAIPQVQPVTLKGCYTATAQQYCTA